MKMRADVPAKKADRGKRAKQTVHIKNDAK